MSIFTTTESLYVPTPGGVNVTVVLPLLPEFITIPSKLPESVNAGFEGGVKPFISIL